MGCNKIISVNIPDSVKVIGEDAFYSCHGITSLTIGNSVTSIDNHAFSGTGLTNLNIPDSVTSIEWSAFSGCTRLTSITIGNGVINIGREAFYGCTNLTDVYNKSSLRLTIGSEDNGYVAYYAQNVVELDLKLGNWDTYTRDGYSFVYNEKTGWMSGYTGSHTNLTLPSSFKTRDGMIIDKYALGYSFYGNVKVEAVTIPNSVISIGEEAFQGCTNLMNVTIGNNVDSIGYGAFLGCTNLKSINIPDSVTIIGQSTFAFCPNLTSVTMENPDGWIVYDDVYNQTTGKYEIFSTEIAGSSLSVQELAAEYLRDTYSDYRWERTN